MANWMTTITVLKLQGKQTLPQDHAIWHKRTLEIPVIHGYTGNCNICICVDMLLWIHLDIEKQNLSQIPGIRKARKLYLMQYPTSERIKIVPGQIPCSSFDKDDLQTRSIHVPRSCSLHPEQTKWNPFSLNLQFQVFKRKQNYEFSPQTPI